MHYGAVITRMRDLEDDVNDDIKILIPIHSFIPLFVVVFIHRHHHITLHLQFNIQQITQVTYNRVILVLTTYLLYEYVLKILFFFFSCFADNKKKK